MKKFLKGCYVQKTNQFDALRIIKDNKENVEMGAPLILDFDKPTPKSEYQVLVKLPDCIKTNGKERIIGVISEEDAKLFSPFLEVGWGAGQLFECLVSSFDEKTEDENKRFSVAIYIMEPKESTD